MSPLLNQPVLVNAPLFILMALGVWRAGSLLPLYADAISDRRRIGKAFVGLVFLASATSLPEIVTTLTGSLAGAPRLVLGTLFGGIAMQTAVLALADATISSRPLTSFPRRPECALQATLLALLLAVIVAISVVGDRILVLDIGIGTSVLAVAYVGMLFMLERYEGSDSWQPVEVLETDEQVGIGPSAKRLDELPLRQLVLRFAAASLVILVCGLILTAAAAALAEQTGLGTSFFGATLLALATSLPEVSTTFAAVRYGAYTMAISNIFGSNLLMIALVFPADLAFVGGPVLDSMDDVTLLALLSGIVVTLVYLAGLLMRSHRKIAGMGLDSALVLGIYGLSLVLLHQLR